MKINYKDIVQRLDLVIDEHIEKGTVEHLKSIELDKNESLQLASYRDLMPANGTSLVYKGVLVIIHESLAQSFDCEDAQAQVLEKVWRGTHKMIV